MVSFTARKPSLGYLMPKSILFLSMYAIIQFQVINDLIIIYKQLLIQGWLIVVYDISTVVDNLMWNPVYEYKYKTYGICKQIFCW